MDKGKRRFLSLFRLDFEGSYSFPSVASIVSLLLFIASYSVLSAFTWNVGVFLAPGEEGWSGSDAIDRAGSIITERIAGSYYSSFQNSLYVLVLLIPLLIAFKLAQGFSNGEIRTLLSYPTNRPKILLTKSLTAILVATITANASSILALLFFYPNLSNVSLMGLLSLALWAFSFLLGAVCTFVAVATKNAPVTIATGMGVWVAGFVLTANPEVTPLIRGIFYQIQMTMLHLMNDVGVFRGPEVLFSDLISSLTFTLVLGAIFLIASLVIFMYREV
ncbi:MAG: hypothetical protein ACW99U_15005 [Candidatus Thorarchaeota archaeon]|jgi:ABC-type transport system involved in multi-copper enzyme maturation permease subunit